MLNEPVDKPTIVTYSEQQSRPRIGRLHVLTDFSLQQRYSHAELTRMAVIGGADTIQFRQKTGAIRHVLLEAERAHAQCRSRGVPFLVNDRLDIALAVGADGVHLGQTDLPISVGRQLLGTDGIVGATASTLAQAREARDQGAEYIGFGPVYQTRSKTNPESVRGLDRLQEVVAAVDIPVIAIAGITAERIPLIMLTGAHGVAVMSAITLSDNPVAATAACRKAIESSIPGHHP